MRVRRESRHEIITKLRSKYAQADRREKGRLVDQVVELTGYHRTYALALLRHGPPPARTARRRSGRPPVYGTAELVGLRVAAEATGWICGKRLAPFLAELIPALEREGAVQLEAAVRERLLRMSAATIDRRLAPLRVSATPRRCGSTKPGSLLKQQVPIRTYTPWDDQRPGFVEIDLVAHGGASAAGTYLHTLDVVDVATGWTECAGVLNKGQQAGFAALTAVRTRLPVPLVGLDSDNGGEFINAHLIRSCQQEQLTFTRGRGYHKDDQAHVEQKNWAVVRQFVGDDRSAGEAALAQLERVYAMLRVYVNGYLPVMQLIGTARVGAKVRKRYATATTPYRRALAAGVVPAEAQAALEAALQAHGPLALRRAIDRELERLWALHTPERAVAPARA